MPTAKDKYFLERGEWKCG